MSKARRAMQIVLGIIVALVILYVVGLVVIARISKRPENLGVVNGRLTACPPTPNCVSTQANDPEHHMEPIPYNGSLSTAAAKQRVLEIIRSMPRVTIVSQRPDYIHAEFRSLMWRFVDDVEFYFDEDAGLIHFRSAARLGRSDLGVNRRRMEQISQRYRSS